MDTRLYLVRIDMYINGIEVYKFRGTTHFIRVPRLFDGEKNILFNKWYWDNQVPHTKVQLYSYLIVY